MIVVFDSSVLIPLILPASLSAALMDRLSRAGHQVALSPPILDEVAEKLHTKKNLRDWLELPDKDIEQFIRDLPKLCVSTPGLLDVAGAVPDDPKDDMILAAALEANAEYIVSEDKHLRGLKQWRGIVIMSRAEFMAELDRLEKHERSPN
jgi:putative PIN family toxin of toxin-antitoxin system